MLICFLLVYVTENSFATGVIASFAVSRSEIAICGFVIGRKEEIFGVFARRKINRKSATSLVISILLWS